MTYRHGHLLVFVAAILFGCGSGGDGTAGSGGSAGGGGSGGNRNGTSTANGVGDPVQPIFDSPPVDQDLDSYCTFETRWGRYSSKQTCIQGSIDLSSRGLADMASAIAAGTIEYNQEIGDQCASYALNAKCTMANRSALSDLCESAFIGKLTQGETCHHRLECAGHADCIGDCNGTTCCEGICGPPRPKTEEPAVPKVPDGKECDPYWNNCELLTSHCAPKSKTCQPRLAAGSKCELFSEQLLDPCVEYADCRGGVCVKQPEAGETCLDNYGPSQVGLCDHTTNKVKVNTTITRCF
jgi:hypothetical protein